MTTAVETVRDEPLAIGGRTFQSRLMVGTGKYPDMETMVRAIEASGAEVVTVAVRRVNLDRTKESSVLHFLDPKNVFLLANTAGCYTAEDAIRYARLAREAGFNDFVKLEVIGDEETLLPDVQGLLEVAKILVKEGFKVLAYTNEDLVTALRLEDAGCRRSCRSASPIGSGLGLRQSVQRAHDQAPAPRPRIVDVGVGGVRRKCHDGAGRGRYSHEYGDCGRAGSRGDGARDAPGDDRGRAAFLAGRMPRRECHRPHQGDAGLRAGPPPVARHSKFCARCAPERRWPMRAIATSPVSPSATAVSPTSCRPECCVASASWTARSSSTAPILASTTCSGSAPISSVT
jgi:thiazole synthase